MKGWTLNDIKKLQEKGLKVEGVESEKIESIKKIEPAGLTEIKNVLIRNNIRFVEEYVFSQKRKFRFDIYLIDMNIGIEYEGLVSEKSRHTTITGYTRDCTKYNLAQLEGIRVLRYTSMNWNEFEDDIKKI